MSVFEVSLTIQCIASWVSFTSHVNKAFDPRHVVTLFGFLVNPANAVERMCQTSYSIHFYALVNNNLPTIR